MGAESPQGLTLLLGRAQAGDERARGELVAWEHLIDGTRVWSASAGGALTSAVLWTSPAFSRRMYVTSNAPGLPGAGPPRGGLKTSPSAPRHQHRFVQRRGDLDQHRQAGPRQYTPF